MLRDSPWEDKKQHTVMACFYANSTWMFVLSGKPGIRKETDLILVQSSEIKVGDFVEVVATG